MEIDDQVCLLSKNIFVHALWSVYTEGAKVYIYGFFGAGQSETTTNNKSIFYNAEKQNPERKKREQKMPALFSF